MSWLVLLLGCAARGPTYVPLDQPLPPAPDTDGASARRFLAAEMERGRLPSITWSPRSGVPDRAVAAHELELVPPEALWLAWVCSPRRMRGSELDLLLHTDDHTRPLTVEVDVDGAVHLRQGTGAPATAPRDDRDAWMRELAHAHGLRAVVDGDAKWTSEELGALDQALELLDDREALLIRDLVVSRDHTSPRNPRELALYDPVADPITIYAYDTAFAAASWSFVGPLSEPLPAPVMTLVHEFGHAISDAPVASAWHAWADARITHMSAKGPDRKLTGLAARFALADRRLVGRRGPVIDAYAAIRPRRLWPTTWSTDVFESFAEAFGLWKTDPDALARVAPEAHAWFSADGHLAWRDFPE